MLLGSEQLSASEIRALCDFRLERLRQQMRSADVSLCVLNNPISLRYAIDFDEYQLFQAHIPTCYLFLPVEGPLQMHGATRRDFPNVATYLRPQFVSMFDGGTRLDERCRQVTQSIVGFMKDNGLWAYNKRIALDRFSPYLSAELTQAGAILIDADVLVEKARAIKSPQELRCIKYSLSVAENALHQMRQATQPGITENQLWSILHQTNIASGGQWIDGRMLSSGPRTNPWLQEATDRILEQGDLIALDTDMIGPMGYCADVSRSWLCAPDATPTAEQRQAYSHALKEVQHNIELVKPGMSFKEFSEKAFPREPEFREQRYPCLAHGVGLSDEYPKIYYPEDWGRDGYDGVLEEDMVLSIESYSGKLGGSVGVKLEQMVHITQTGCEVISNFHYEDTLS
ncbi:MAG: Xaa-Pro peptidase family protein [Pseudomonadota bacterium]